MIRQHLRKLLPALVALHAGVAEAQVTRSTTIATSSTTGPLTSIFVGVEGSVQIYHVIDGTVGEVYPSDGIPGDSGMLIFVGGALYAPDFDRHSDGSAASSIGDSIPFTPVMQSPVTGTGTFSDPFIVSTVFDAGSTGLRVTETDQYVAGQESYLTTMLLENTSSVARDLILYRATDCYLNGSDDSYGYIDAATGAVACSVSANNSPPARIEQWLPISPGSHYFQDNYDSVWAWIGMHLPFPDTCRCDETIDTGAGLSWEISIPPGASANRSLITTFSPIGAVPLVTTKSADTSSVSPGASNGYTIVVVNPNTFDATLDQVIDDLPAGFTYTPGSTTGVVTAEPAITGQTLSWSGPIDVTAQSSVMLHFDVTVATATGAYFNNALASAAGGLVVSPTGDTARVAVLLNLPQMDGGTNDDSGTIADGGGSGDGGATGDTGGTMVDGGGRDSGTGGNVDSGLGTADTGAGGSQNDDDDEGCGCDEVAGRRPLGVAWLAMALVVWFLRRRSQNAR